ETEHAASQAEPPGDPVSSENDGGSTNDTRDAGRAYRARIIQWLARGFHVQGSGLARDQLDALRVTARIETRGRTVIGYRFELPVVFALPVAILLAYAVPRGRQALADVDTGGVQEVAGTIDAMIVNSRTGQARARIGAIALDFYGAGPVQRWEELRKLFSQA